MQPIVAWQGDSYKKRNDTISFALTSETKGNITIDTGACILKRAFASNFSYVNKPLNKKKRLNHFHNFLHLCNYLQWQNLGCICPIHTGSSGLAMAGLQKISMILKWRSEGIHNLNDSVR